MDDTSGSNVLPQILGDDNYLIECDPGLVCRRGRFSMLAESGSALLNQAELRETESSGLTTRDAGPGS